MKLFTLIVLATWLAGVAARADGLAPLNEALHKKWPQNRTINIVFHGHSVPAGYHQTPTVKPFESYPYLLNVKLKERYPTAVINVIVTAIGGEDSVSGAARFEKDVLTHHPDLIFIDYALNDRRKPADQIEKAWRTMIGQGRKAGVPVVLLTPTGDATADLSNPADPLRQRADLIRSVAKEEQTLLADVSAAWLAEIAKGTPPAQLLSQVNHPNLRGHEIAAAALMQCLSAGGLKP